MERATMKDEHGYYLVGDGIYSDWGVLEKFRGDDIDRLAAYEGTGLEPEEIELMEKQRDLYVDACGGLPLRRIRELVQADKEERCDEPKRITVDDVKLMVEATKKTTSWDGKTAYDVPVGEGKCVESFPRAVRLWCDFLGVKFKWR
ncbi:hypothetical protein [Flavonifractor plautii]|uniref:hypothetical protein n=1 Tax=Flavonifractor plautii TaxID=292800 RepID=UPI00189AF1BE|nr:hypothetical protein [Flavonifractor plautii]